MITSPRAIVLFQSDQHRADCAGFAGHPMVQTPHLDRLAAAGVHFTRAFTPSPICVPARTCLETGRWPIQHGVLANWDTEIPRWLDPTAPTWARQLAQSGWSVDYVGRWHVHPNLPPTAFGYSSFISDSDYHLWRDAQGLPPMPKAPSDDPAKGFFGEVDEFAQPGQSQLAWLANQAIERIRARAEDHRPFLVRIDCLQPHLPCRPSASFADRYPADQITPWPSFEDDLSRKPYIQGQQQRNWAIEAWGWERWAPLVSRYFAEITEMDEQIGRIQTALADAGIADDTLFIYTSDHGDLCGGHRMIDKHYVMYEDVVRIPLVMSWPNGIAARGPQPDFVSHAIDLPRTLCELAGMAPPESFARNGISLLPALRGEAERPRRSDIYSSYNGNQFGLCSQRMVRDDRWKYVWNATWEDELYDLECDPYELRNRASDPESAKTLQALRLRLLAWLEATDDPLKNYWIEPTLRANRKR